MRVGVVADTHCPEFLDRLPDSVERALTGVELILHAGDVGGQGGEETLARLRAIAPVEAVSGDHDRGLDPPLPARRELVLEGVRVGLVHGNRSRLIEEPITFLGTITLGVVWPRSGLRRWLRGQFPTADVVVYGHTHDARAERSDGAVLFNPGAVYQVGRDEVARRLTRRPGWFEWTWLQVIRHRRRVAPPTVGILEIVEGRVTTRVVPLR